MFGSYLKSFQILRTKCAYYVVYGLPPYFKELLFQNIKSYHLAPCYLMKWMFKFRFGDDQSGEVERYLNSRFLKRPNAENILEELLKSIANLRENVHAFHGWSKHQLVSAGKIDGSS